MLLVFFFFKQKTAYELRISDWSSDVCSSDLSPSKGRFLNSPIGWTSEVVNKQKLKAYGLSDSYVNFRSGSGAALDAEISSSIRRGKPILFYYWSPTPLLGRFTLVQLQEIGRAHV